MGTNMEKYLVYFTLLSEKSRLQNSMIPCVLLKKNFAYQTSKFSVFTLNI